MSKSIATNGKQKTIQTSGTANASLTSHESIFLSFAVPAVLIKGKASFKEPHRDATPFDPALGQSEMPPVVSLGTHCSKFHLNPQMTKTNVN